MKRSKRLAVMVGTLLLVAAVTVFVLQYEEKKEEIKTSGEIILALSPEEVKGISWENDENTLGFSKDEKWSYDGDEAFPVKEEAVEELLTWFEEFRASFVIENVEDYGQYGLDDPEYTIILTTEEQTYEILFGDFSTMDEERYVSIGDGNAYLAMEDPTGDFDSVLSDFIAHDEVPELEEAQKISFAGIVEYDAVLKEDSITYDEEDLYYVESDGEDVALNPVNVTAYLSAIENLNLTDYKTYSVTEEELEEFGLVDPTLTITVDYLKEKEGEEKAAETLNLAVSADPADVDVTDEDAQFSAYVRINESGFVYEITKEEYKTLLAASIEDLRYEKLFWGDFDLVTKMDIRLEGEEYSITTSGNKEDRTYFYGDNEIDISDMENAVTDLKTVDFTAEEGEGKEEIRLCLYLDNENVPQVEMEFYRQDGSSCLAVIDGKPFALVQREDVVDLMEAVNAIVLQ